MSGASVSGRLNRQWDIFIYLQFVRFSAFCFYFHFTPSQLTLAYRRILPHECQNEHKQRYDVCVCVCSQVPVDSFGIAHCTVLDVHCFFSSHCTHCKPCAK